MRWQLGIGGFCRQNPEQNQRFLDMQQNSAAKGLDGAESGVWQFDADIKQCRSYHVCITTHGIAQSVQYRPVAYESKITNSVLGLPGPQYSLTSTKVNVSFRAQMNLIR